MRLQVAARFRCVHAGLSTEDQKQIQKTLRTMAQELRHPGLRVKRIRGTQRIWEAREPVIGHHLLDGGDAIVLRAT